ncbi:MAG TPA: hypothetical protein DHW22_07060, partial [Planctomycetaceae bacterium]|nr:hypothetical protein [Planctomycetaceae bacterium]
MAMSDLLLFPSYREGLSLINPSDHSETTGLDASDVDGGSKVRHWPVLGFYQPDGIAVFEE